VIFARRVGAGQSSAHDPLRSTAVTRNRSAYGSRSFASPSGSGSEALPFIRDRQSGQLGTSSRDRAREQEARIAELVLNAPVVRGQIRRARRITIDRFPAGEQRRRVSRATAAQLVRAAG
jgi:hypothetical protein